MNAERLAAASSLLAQQLFTDQMSAAAHYYPALVNALIGRLDEAREQALIGLATAERIGDAIFAAKHRGVLGFVELSTGNAADTHTWLEPAVAQMITSGVRDTSTFEVFKTSSTLL